MSASFILCSVLHFVALYQRLLQSALSPSVSTRSQSFLQRWHAELVNGNYTGLPEIPCVPLPDILRKLGVIKHISFYSLDVEGGELSVLQSVDFSVLSFDVLSIEADGGNPEKDQGVIDLLASKGYKLHGHVQSNDWFVREGFVPSAAPSAV